MATLKAAILVVSDTAARDASADKSTEAIKEVFALDGKGQWEVTNTKIVSDNATDIVVAILGWTEDPDSRPNLVLTTGGTGFAMKDITPEVSGKPTHQVWSQLDMANDFIGDIGRYSPDNEACVWPRVRIRTALFLC
jgi:gephyrin